jgi:hypothetical protein
MNPTLSRAIEDSMFFGESKFIQISEVQGAGERIFRRDALYWALH